MDEEEELFREMNPEDGFYMGPKENDSQNDELKREDIKKDVEDSREGCLGGIIFILLLIFIYSTF